MAEHITYNNKFMKKKILYIVLTMIVSSAVVVGLFLSSEHIMKKENPFVRRFLPHPITDVKGLELPYNSYYISGFSEDKIYLGNYTAPLHGLVLNNVPQIIDTIILSIAKFEKQKFSAIKWNFLNDTILLNDYTLGVFYIKGDEKDEMTRIVRNDTLKYSISVPLATNSYALRTFTDKTKEKLSLALYDPFKNRFINKKSTLFESNQAQDLFSNDGMLLYNKDLQKIIYVFYYKNKSFVFNNDLEERQILETIDTISIPNFKLQYVEKQRLIKPSQIPVKVNKMAATA